MQVYRINFNLFNFDDFVVVNREKLGTRALKDLYDRYHKKYTFSNGIEEYLKVPNDSFQYHDIYQYYIDDFAAGLRNDYPCVKESREYFDPYINIYNYKLPNYQTAFDNLKTQEKRLKKNYSKWYSIISKIKEENNRIFSKIAKNSFDKPIIFLYKSPLQHVLTALLQDLDAVFFDENEVLDFSKYSIDEDEIRNWWSSRYHYDKRFKKYYFNALEALRDSIKENNSEIRNSILDFIAEKLKFMLKNNSIFGAHRSLWISAVLPIFNNNKNLVLVNLDKGDISWDKLFDKYSTLKYEFDAAEMIVNNKILNSNKDSTNALISTLNNDMELQYLIYNFYAAEFFTYNVISRDPRNITDIFV